MFTLFEIILLAFVAFIFVYALTDRICKCIEQRNEVRAFSELAGKHSLDEWRDAFTKNNIL